MTNPKIVQITWNWIKESGGASQAVLNFAEALNSTVISFTKNSGGQYIGSDIIDQIHIPYNDIELNRYAYSSSPIKKHAETVVSDADLIIIHGIYRYHFDWAVRIANKNRIPYWIVPHGSLDPYVFTYRALVKRFWFLAMGNLGFSIAKQVVFATEAERDKSKIKVSSEQSKIIHWPVDYVDTHGSIEAKSKIRREFDIPYDAKVLIYIGRFHPMKRPVETINAVAGCNSDNVYLLMMGPDSDVMTMVDCEKHCVKNGYKNIRFIKPTYGKEKYDFFMAADAFISLSHRENFGYTVAEALSTGIAVILSPGNDLSKDIRHLNCGWLLADDKFNSAINAVKEFAVTPSEVLFEMGHRGQQWARAELSLERFNSILEAVALGTIAKAKQAH